MLPWMYFIVRATSTLTINIHSAKSYANWEQVNAFEVGSKVNPNVLFRVSRSWCYGENGWTLSLWFLQKNNYDQCKKKKKQGVNGSQNPGKSSPNLMVYTVVFELNAMYWRRRIIFENRCGEKYLRGHVDYDPFWTVYVFTFNIIPLGYRFTLNGSLNAGAIISKLKYKTFFLLCVVPIKRIGNKLLLLR